MASGFGAFAFLAASSLERLLDDTLRKNLLGTLTTSGSGGLSGGGLPSPTLAVISSSRLTVIIFVVCDDLGFCLTPFFAAPLPAICRTGTGAGGGGGGAPLLLADISISGVLPLILLLLLSLSLPRLSSASLET
jgi:hypothetical protein